MNSINSACVSVACHKSLQVGPGNRQVDGCVDDNVQVSSEQLQETTKELKAPALISLCTNKNSNNSEESAAVVQDQGDEFQCMVCLHQAEDLRGYLDHGRTHRGPLGKTEYCSVCGDYLSDICDHWGDTGNLCGERMSALLERCKKRPRVSEGMEQESRRRTQKQAEDPADTRHPGRCFVDASTQKDIRQFTPGEDMLLMHIHQRYPGQWNIIASSSPNLHRTASALEERYSIISRAQHTSAAQIK